MFVSVRSIFLFSPLPPLLPALWLLVTRAARGMWILPLFLALLAAVGAPAQAQIPPQTVVVLDFEVGAGVDPLMGRKAADAVAVELQRSGVYNVVTRQRVDEVRRQQAGLQEPFDQVTQTRFAAALGAGSVFSGRVLGVETTTTRASRVRLEVRRLEAATGDYVEGAQVSESAEQPVVELMNEVLADQALNKASYAAVRALEIPSTRTGNILNTTRDDVELSIGTRDGVAVGQRYAVLRDIYDPNRRITRRLKTGELVITTVQSNQSVGVLTSGGEVGSRTGDRVRQIYIPDALLPTRNNSKSSGNNFKSSGNDSKTRRRFNSRTSPSNPSN